MSKVDGSLGSLVQGVSQQPARARLPGQSEEQINCTNDEVFGLSRRASTEVRSKGGTLGSGASIEEGSIRYGGEDLNYVMRTGASPLLRIHGDDMDTVTLQDNSATYLATDGTSAYERAIIFREVGEDIFVVNTQRTVETLPDLTDQSRFTNDQTAIVYCLGGQYGTGYKIKIELGATTHTFVYATPDGSSSAHTEQARVNYIMAQLFFMMTNAPDGGAAAGTKENPDTVGSDEDWVPDAGKLYTSTGAYAFVNSNFDVSLVGEHIILTKKTAGDFSTSGTSGGRGLMETAQRTVKTAGTLPLRAPHGKVLTIAGSTRAEDDYYLRFVVDGGTTGTIEDKDGVWEECTSPYEPYMLDPETMPHILYHTGSFWAVKEAEWKPRRAGDNLSNSMPRFVGGTIQDFVEFQGRAAILHDAEFTTSVTNDPTDMFKKTATTGLETDPINLRSTSADAGSKNIYAVPLNRDLIIFADNNVQYMVSGRGKLKPDSAAMLLTSEFDMDTHVRPQSIGNSLLFASYTGKYTHVHEMYLKGDQESHARRTVTDHVPRYLVGPPRIMAADDGANFAAVVCEDRGVIYVYEYLWQDDRRVQSAWSTWHISGEVYGLSISDGKMHIMQKTPNEGYLMTFVRLYREDTDGLDFAVHLDAQERRTLAFPVTTLTVQCPSGDTDRLRVIAMDGNVPGSRLKIIAAGINAGDGSAPTEATVTLAEPYVGEVIHGETYPWRFVPTMPVVKDRDGVAQSQAKLAVSSFHITFENSGPFDMIRQSTYETEEEWWTMRYSGRTLGDPDFQLGTIPLDEGTVSFPFSDRSATSQLVLTTDTYLPITLTEIEWTGNIHNRSRRVTNGG